jgi:spermidine synthase
MIRSKPSRRIYLVVLFLSGLTSLIYQVLWIREFSLFFGVHVYSVSTVLAAFMGGLALGSLLFGKLADKYPGKAYIMFFLVQIGLGAFALIFGILLSTLSGLYVNITRAFELSITLQNLIRPLFGFLLLVIPSTLMGGVIPVASRLFVSETSQVGSRVSLIYFVNNLGAVAGCFLSGFILVALLGTKGSFHLASAINFLCGAIGLLYFTGYKKHRQSDGVVPDEINPGNASVSSGDELTSSYPDKLIHIALWVFALEGFTTLAYEVLWTRMMVEFSFEKTIYFTTIVIMSFILGLTIGGYIFHRIEGRIRNLFRFLGLIQVFAGLSSLVLFIVFNRIAPEMISARTEITSWWSIALREYGLMIVILSIPTIFTGMSFPLISKLYTQKMAHLGSRVGLAGMLDTIASIGGSLVAGFIMLPILGVYVSFMMVVAMNLVLGLVVFHYDVAIKREIRIILKAGLPAILVIALFIFPRSAYEQLHQDYYRGDQVVFRKEGVAATVRVVVQPTGHYALVINGSKTAFTNNDDLRVHKLLAYLPYLFNPQAQSACVIGFGLGVTSGTLTSLNIPDVTVADICPELLTSATIFTAYNNNVVNDPRFTFIPEDGRSYLLRTPKNYDIITSNAVHARLNANLYTREFYELCANRLNPGGIVCQWVPTNWMTRDEFMSLIRAFTDVFDQAQLWFVTRGHLVLVGSPDPMIANYQDIETLYRDRSVMADLSFVDLFTPQRFAAGLLLEGEDLKAFSSTPRVNTDDFPLVEFSRETDLKPNTEVLQELADFPADIAIHFPDSTSRNLNLEIIRFENEAIKQYLRQFVRVYGR